MPGSSLDRGRLRAAVNAYDRPAATSAGGGDLGGGEPVGEALEEGSVGDESARARLENPEPPEAAPPTSSSPDLVERGRVVDGYGGDAAPARPRGALRDGGEDPGRARSRSEVTAYDPPPAPSAELIGGFDVVARTRPRWTATATAAWDAVRRRRLGRWCFRGRGLVPVIQPHLERKLEGGGLAAEASWPSPGTCTRAS